MVAFFKSIAARAFADRSGRDGPLRLWVSATISAVVVVAVVGVFVFGRGAAALDDAGLQAIMAEARASRWALPAVASVFMALALTGFPQVLLITATVLVFGPVQGAAFSWISTLCSAFLTFFIGRVSGGAWVGRLGGERIRGVVAFLGRRGLAASALVRVVPSAPFIVVNAAAGAALIPIWKFAVGTAAGIVPKIALVAALGAAAPDGAVLQDGFAGLVAFFRSWTPAHVVAVAAIALAWAAAAALAHRLYADLRGRGGSL